MKKILAIMLALIMALAMVPALAEGETTITSLDEITGAGSYILGNNIAVGQTLTISAEVTIDGSGKTLTYADGFTGTMFNVTSGGKLTLKNVTIDGENNWTCDESGKVTSSGKTITGHVINADEGNITIENTKFTNLYLSKASTIYAGSIITSSIENTAFDHCAGIGSPATFYSHAGWDWDNGFKKYNSNFSFNGMHIKNCYSNEAIFRITGVATRTVNLTGCNISDNRVVGKNKENNILGFYNAKTLNITNSTISNNTADNNLLFFGGDVGLTFDSSNIKNNKCGNVYATYGPSGKGLDFRSGEISGNTNSKGTGSSIWNTYKLNIGEDMTISTPMDLAYGSEMTNNGTINGNVAIHAEQGKSNTNNGTINGDVTLYNHYDKTESSTFTSSGDIHGTVKNESGTDNDGKQIGQIIITGGQYNELPEGTQVHGFRVNFDANGGSVSPAVIVYPDPVEDHIHDFSFPTPTRGGYDFVGWFTAATGGIQVKVDDMLPKGDPTTDGGQEVAPVTAITLYAHWTEQQPSGGGNGGGGHWHPTTTPVPVIVIPPKTGDMTIWQSILHFLGIR